jgi:hypothetical protein
VEKSVIELNSTFNTLIVDLEAVFDVQFSDHDQALNLIKTAFSEVMNEVSQRCKVCDSEKLLCVDCEGNGIAESTRDLLKGYIDEP